MPHVEEGELHALLDGAFAHDGPAAARIREEIATCAECHARFAEAQALRMRASAVLERAVPRPLAPPFAAIIDRAGTVDAPRPFRFPAGAPLAWAATIVLALGLGWFGRDWLNAPPTSGRMAERAAATRESAPSSETVAAQMETIVAPPPAAAPPALKRREEAESRPAQPLADAAGATGSSANQTGARRADTETKAAAGRTANAPTQSAFARDSGAARSNEPRSQRAAAPPAAAPAERITAATALAKEESTEWEYGTVAQAERTTGRRVLLVPDLEVVNVGVRSMDGRYVTRTLQKLPDGNVIEIVQESVQEADRIQAERVEERSAGVRQAAQSVNKDELGANVVKVTRVGWVLTGRATLAQDSLLVLLNRAR